MATPRSRRARDHDSNQFSVPTPVPRSPASRRRRSSQSARRPTFVADGGVVYAFSGAPLVLCRRSRADGRRDIRHVAAGNLSLRRRRRGQGRRHHVHVRDAASYAPNLTPVYALTDLDFIDEKGNKDPVQVAARRPLLAADDPAHRVSLADNQYCATPVEARDQSQIDSSARESGRPSKLTKSATSSTSARSSRRRSCSASSMSGPISRSSCPGNIACSIRWTSSRSPTPISGFSNYPVRIVAIEEDDKGSSPSRRRSS